MKPITQTINLINTRKINTTHAKISVAKITPTITINERDSVDTPPIITDYVRAFAIIIKNSNEITTHADAFTRNHVAFMNESNDKLRAISISKNDPALRPRYYFTHSYTEHADSNVNRADKPAFRNDSVYLFDNLSEGYRA